MPIWPVWRSRGFLWSRELASLATVMRTRTPSALLFLVLAVLTLGAASCSDDSGANGDDGDRVATIADLVATGEGLPEGETLYNANCASCHGGDGQGGVGPQLAGVVADKYTPAEHVGIVVNGRAAMPAFASSLDDDEIAAIVRYERSQLGQ